MHKSEASNRSPPGANELTEAIDRCRPGGTHWTSQLPRASEVDRPAGNDSPQLFGTMPRERNRQSVAARNETQRMPEWMTPPGRTMRIGEVRACQRNLRAQTFRKQQAQHRTRCSVDDPPAVGMDPAQRGEPSFSEGRASPRRTACNTAMACERSRSSRTERGSLRPNE